MNLFKDLITSITSIEQNQRMDWKLLLETAFQLLPNIKKKFEKIN